MTSKFNNEMLMNYYYWFVAIKQFKQHLKY